MRSVDALLHVGHLRGRAEPTGPARQPRASSRAAPVNLAALVEANGPAATVFVLDATEGVARRRQVTVGPIVGDRVIVVAGLEPGEQVVTDGAAWLTDGRAVHVVGGQADAPG